MKIRWAEMVSWAQVCQYRISYDRLWNKYLSVEDKVSLVKVPDGCSWKGNYYLIHEIEHKLCLLNFRQISSSYLKSNVPESSKWKVVCLGTFACVPDKCRTGCHGLRPKILSRDSPNSVCEVLWLRGPQSHSILCITLTYYPSGKWPVTCVHV